MAESTSNQPKREVLMQLCKTKVNKSYRFYAEQN